VNSPAFTIAMPSTAGIYAKMRPGIGLVTAGCRLSSIASYDVSTPILLVSEDCMPAVTYLSPLSKFECLERLRHSTRRMRFADRFAHQQEGTIYGWLGGDRFRLYAEGPKWVSNSYAPYFYGRLISTAEGTVISGRFGIHWYTMAFSAVWVTAVGLVALLFAFHAILPPYYGVKDLLTRLIGACVPLLMLAFFYGLLKVCNRMGNNQRARMLEFLQSTLEASSVPGDHAASSLS
jgi:hypothetical protein